MLGHRVRAGVRAWGHDLVIALVVTAGVCVVAFLIVSMMALGAQRIGYVVPVRGIDLGMALSVAVGVAAGAVAVRRCRRDRARTLAEIRAARVEVIRVEGARLIEREPHNDEGPIYYFDIGAGRILLLAGPWLYDETFGLSFDDPDFLAKTEALFPASSFTVHRLAASETVVRIDAAGPRLMPLGTLQSHRAVPKSFAQQTGNTLPLSRVVNGDFEELLAAAERSS